MAGNALAEFQQQQQQLQQAASQSLEQQQQQQQEQQLGGAQSAFSPVVPMLPIDSSSGYDSTGLDNNVVLNLPDASEFPLAKLRLYISEVNNDREAAAAALSDAVHLVNTDADLDLFLTAIGRLASDDEASVRAEVAQRLVNLVTYCHKQLPDGHVLQGIARSHLIPILLHLVHDNHAQIR